MKKVLLSVLLIIAFVSGQSQDFDTERMERDLEVAENVFSALIHENMPPIIGLGHMSTNLEATYIEDYGVIFSINKNEGLSMHPQLWTPKASFKHQKDVAKVLAKTKTEKNKWKDKGASVVIPDENVWHHEEDPSKLKKACKTFLMDYGHLITQLNDKQRIKVNIAQSPQAFAFVNSPSNNFSFDFTKYGHSDNTKTISLELGVKDISDYQKNRIDRDQLLERITITESEIDRENYKDLELFASIFNKLYQMNMSTTYYSSTSVSYDKLDGFGLVFKMKLYSSYESKDLFVMPTLANESVTLEERNQKVENTLPKFEKEFKENLINYGRTIQNLKGNESILFEVEMTQCTGCENFPHVIKFKVNKSTLDRYSTGKLTLAQAVEKIEMEKYL